MEIPKTKVPALILIACALMAAQTLPLLAFRWVEDESWYSACAAGLVREGKIRNVIFAPEDPEAAADTRPLAMPVTLAATIKTLGWGPVRERFPFWLASLALIPLTYWIGKTLGSSLGGLMGAFLASVETTVFMASRTVRPEAFVAAFGAAAVLCHLLSRKHQSTGWAILSGLALGLACNYHVNGYGIAASIGLLLLGEFGLSVWRQKRAWAVVLTCVAMLIPFFIWVHGDALRERSFHYLYGRGHSLTAMDMVRSEVVRYEDYLGMSNQRFSLLPYPLPLRLPVVLLYLAGFAILAYKQRPLFWKLLALLIPSLFLWPREVNSTFRFFVILTPYLAITAGAAFAMLESAKWRRLFALWCLLAIAMQIAGNAVVLAKARSADYPSVTRQLRASIPPGAGVYGAMTFFMALQDHPYYSWNRGSVQGAVKLGVTYLILNDRVLLNGSGFGGDDWKEVREQADAFVATRADLVGHIPDPFYGDLKIYRVK